MKIRSLRRPRTSSLVAALAATGLCLAGCGQSSPVGDDIVRVDSAPDFDPESTMAKLHDAGKIKIGVKFDQPGIGYLKPGSHHLTGFDIEIARIIAGKLGIKPSHIKWVETISSNREKFLRNRTVDLVLATYSITPERRKIVGMAGPYYTTGQQLLVRQDEKSIKGPKSTVGRKVCSITGTTSIDTFKQVSGVTPVTFPAESDCVRELLNKNVDAFTTDGAILLGYAAQHPKALKVVGDPFTQERYGVGYRKGDRAMCEFIKQTLWDSYNDGTWVNALFGTLRQQGASELTPDLDPCT
ncbi:glutamate ABC transporter substrate-binding protein [Wenjunlia tyrosinilytica]|uniref:Glutamate ABC transporter substrate-binding protein n=1 Tax=Wenjunlia tyrosinilytica TaxID=1544741 RepID=A0A917ZV80_9ACTN|nr:glutamate ABC transporter substrate-binding protein [Wenjunlia tyrosinilytica]GGO95842.1 glutamate ABC transporter substrate-binding protein [Wenjunlia tyrosinilytica]